LPGSDDLTPFRPAQTWPTSEHSDACRVAGAALHLLTHPRELLPMIGASAAVARRHADVASAQAEDFIDGQVTKVDQGAGKITIKHGPIRKLGMDQGMTMVFRAGDPAMLKSVKAGDKIKFAPDLVDGQFTVTKIRKAK
jgi:Cu/Ag efflux protein CusF